MYVFCYALLFICELLVLVSFLESLRQLCPWTTQALFLLWWFRWLLAVQVLNPDFYWSVWRGVSFWGLQCLSSFIYVQDKHLFFGLLYLCGVMVSGFSAYLHDSGNSRLKPRDSFFLVFLAINLLACVLLWALVDLQHLVQSWVRARQRGVSNKIREAMTFTLPLTHAGCWLLWGILLQAGQTREAFLMYFGCTAAQFGALHVQMQERRFQREVDLELVEIQTYLQ